VITAAMATTTTVLSINISHRVQKLESRCVPALDGGNEQSGRHRVGELHRGASRSSTISGLGAGGTAGSAKAAVKAVA
jgi:hypothetical protein